MHLKENKDIISERDDFVLGSIHQANVQYLTEIPGSGQCNMHNIQTILFSRLIDSCLAA